MRVAVVGATGLIGRLGVTWSLAIEEQFYLLWPLAVRYLSRSRLRQVCIAVILASPFVRLYLAGHGVDLYTDLFCRLDGLMAGAFFATVVREPAFEPRRYVNAAWAVLAVALPLALATDGRGVQWIVYSLSVLASAGLVYLALFSPSRLLQRVMTSRALVFTGTISYGLYLLHKLPFDVVKGRTFAHPALVFALLIAAAYLLACASWYLLEQPFLRFKRFFQSGKRTGDPSRSASLALPLPG